MCLFKYLSSCPAPGHVLDRSASDSETKVLVTQAHYVGQREPYLCPSQRPAGTDPGVAAHWAPNGLVSAHELPGGGREWRMGWTSSCLAGTPGGGAGWASLGAVLASMVEWGDDTAIAGWHVYPIYNWHCATLGWGSPGATLTSPSLC